MIAPSIFSERTHKNAVILSGATEAAACGQAAAVTSGERAQSKDPVEGRTIPTETRRAAGFLKLH